MNTKLASRQNASLQAHSIKASTRDIIVAALAADTSATETITQSILAAADGNLPNRDDRLPLPVWARKEEVQRLTGCPDRWLFAFAASHPADFRKFADARNGSAVYRVSAVLNAIESKEVR